MVPPSHLSGAREAVSRCRVQTAGFAPSRKPADSRRSQHRLDTLAQTAAGLGAGRQRPDQHLDHQAAVVDGRDRKAPIFGKAWRSQRVLSHSATPLVDRATGWERSLFDAPARGLPRRWMPLSAEMRAPLRLRLALLKAGRCPDPPSSWPPQSGRPAFARLLPA